MGTPWDARTYDRSSEPQQAWASEVLTRLEGIAQDATAMDVGCGTGHVTEALLAFVPRGRVLAIDASADMVVLARRRLGDRAEVWCQDVLDLDLDEPVDAIVSTATLHWVTDHDRLWARLARALRPGGVLEVQCGGEGNIDGVRDVIEAVARDAAPELVGWSPWVFAGPQETERRLGEAGFTATRCWLEERPTDPRTWARSCARRSSRRTSRACPRSGGRGSPPRSWRGCAYRWTSCASTSPPSADRLEELRAGSSGPCWRLRRARGSAHQYRLDVQHRTAPHGRQARPSRVTERQHAAEVFFAASTAIAIQPQTPSPPLAATFVQHPPTIDGCERLRSAQLTLAARGNSTLSP